MFLSSHLANLVELSINDVERDRALQHFIDWLFAALVGLRLNVGRRVTTLTERNRSDGDVTIVGIGNCDVMTALIHNSALGNAAELDDYHRLSVTHPGPIVIPVAFATAQREKRDIQEFLNGIVVGYEVMTRMGMTVGPGHYRQWHKTATCGTFAATATAARVCGYDANVTKNALGHAGSMAGGIWQCRTEATETKQLHSSHAAISGYLSATAAQALLRGPSAVFEGEFGYFPAACPDPDTSFLTAPFTHWSILDTSLKPWPCCRHTHSTVLALQTLFNEHGPFASEEIDKITIDTFSEAISLCDNPEPNHETAARFSLQHVAATTVLHGKPKLDDFNKTMRDDPLVRHLRQRVELIECLNATDAYPTASPTTVTLTTKNGNSFAAKVSQPPGDPELPLTRAQMTSKASDILNFIDWDGAPTDLVDIYTEPLHRDLTMESLRTLVDCFAKMSG